MELSCPYCEERLEVQEEYLGKAAICPFCGETIDIPEELPEPLPVLKPAGTGLSNYADTGAQSGIAEHFSAHAQAAAENSISSSGFAGDKGSTMPPPLAEMKPTVTVLIVVTWTLCGITFIPFFPLALAASIIMLVCSIIMVRSDIRAQKVHGMVALGLWLVSFLIGFYISFKAATGG